MAPGFPWLVHCGSGSRSSLCLDNGKKNGYQLLSSTQTLAGSEEFMEQMSIPMSPHYATFQTTNRRNLQPQANAVHPRPFLSLSVTSATLPAIGSGPSLLQSSFHPRARMTLFKALLWPWLPSVQTLQRLDSLPGTQQSSVSSLITCCFDGHDKISCHSASCCPINTQIIPSSGVTIHCHYCSIFLPKLLLISY